MHERNFTRLARTLLTGLVVERVLVGVAGTVKPILTGRGLGLNERTQARGFGRMFGLRHLGLGAVLFILRKDSRTLAKVAAINGALEAGDAVLARGRPRFTAGALVGACGCFALAALARPQTNPPT